MNTNRATNESTALASIPNSLREQLERAQLLLNQSESAAANFQPDVAWRKAQQAMVIITTLIEHSYESGMLAVLADMGCQGYEFETIEVTEGHVVVDRNFLGMSFGQSVIPTRTVVRRYSRGRVF